MASSFIHITFTADLPIGAQLGFDIINDGGTFGTPTSVAAVFNWVLLRSSNNQVSKGSPTAILGERSAMNFVSAFNLDISGYVVSRIQNVVTIEAQNLYGSITTFSVGGIFAGYTNHASLSISTANFTPTEFTMIHRFSNGDCSNITLDVTTNTLAAKILSPIIELNNPSNPFQIPLSRGQTILLKLENEFGFQIQETIRTPDYLVREKFIIKTFLQPDGFITMIIINQHFGLDILYIIGSVNTSNNIFVGLEVGVSYDLNITDQFGCALKIKVAFTEIGLLQGEDQTPYFYISKSNALRFALQGQSTKTDESTLSHEATVVLPYQEVQQFYASDIITTQFKSNFSNHYATWVADNGTQTPLAIDKKTNNIGVFDKRDAHVFGYNTANGKTAIYFTSGNIYDVNDAFVNSYYLNGGLPEWAKVGALIQYEQAYSIIEEIIFDNDKNAYLAIFSYMYSGTGIGIRPITCIYNREEFDVFEFTMNGSVALLANGSVAPVNFEYKSEKIKCEPTAIQELLEIKYWNTTNLDVMYSTGIKHILRVPYLNIKGKLDENSEVNKSDTNTSLLKADLYEVEEFKFAPVTKGIWRKLCQALSHNQVFIDGVGYVKNGSFNTDGPLGQSNLYVLTATMIKTGNIYNE